MGGFKKKDPIRRVGSNERALRVGRLRVCGRAFLFVLVDSGFGRNQKGISPSADGDPGLCPENPQTFEKV